MNKLQLYIYKAVRGFKSVQNINPAENIQRQIRDVRQALELVDYDPTDKYLFYLIRYIDQGTFFTILRTIPEKPLDHLASTIFIPNGLQIGRDELAEIVGRTARMVSNPSVTSEDIVELHELFGKEYPVEPDAPAMVESHGRHYAFSFYGGDTGRALDDFFGPEIYQTAFLGYSGVLLVDADLNVAVDAPDLTDMPLRRPATLCPPEELPNGFAPYIFGRVFDRKYRVSMATTVDVVWKRKGFNDLDEKVEITEPVHTLPTRSMDDSRKTITRASFYITGHGGKQTVENAEITVNGVEITGEHQFSFDDLKSANVVVNAKGYRQYQATLDLAATSQALISLHEQRRIYGFELPVKSSELGSPIRFEIHTKRQLVDSPLEGYSLVGEMREGAGRINHLQYTGASAGIAVRQAIVYAAGALVAGFLLGWLLMSGGSSAPAADGENPDSSTTSVVQNVTVVDIPQPEPAKTEPDKKEDNADKTDNVTSAFPAPFGQVAQQAQQQPAAQTADVTAESIAYLDGNAKWTRDDLERMPGLAGLFDDLNNFRLERITTYWAPKLSKSTRFSKLAYHAKESMNKKIFKAEGTYCTDGAISVQPYLYRIDPAKK